MKALVVGGGPAGASAAIGLRETGQEVKLVEQRPVWAGRVCGSFLSPEASLQLERLNLIPKVASEAVAVSETRLTLPSGFERIFPMVQRNRPALALPRQALETALLKEAENRGVEVQKGVRFLAHEKARLGWKVDLLENGRHTSQHVDLLVLADGRFSSGHPKKEIQSNGWYGFNCSYENIAQTPGQQSLHFFPGGYVGVITYADGTSNVCGLFRRKSVEKISWEEVLSDACHASPPLEKLLAPAHRLGEWHGTGPLPFGVYLNEKSAVYVGDAAAVGDPFMGEGIGRALSAGPMLKAVLRPLPNNEQTGDLLAAAHAKLWKKTYGRRWKFNAALRWMLAHKATFHSLELLLHTGPFLTHVTRLFHTGFDPDTIHEAA